MMIPTIDFHAQLRGHKPVPFYHPFKLPIGYEPPYWIQDRKLFDSMRKKIGVAATVSLKTRLYFGMIGLDVVNNVGSIKADLENSKRVTKLVVFASSPVVEDGLVNLDKTAFYVSNQVVMNLAKTNAGIIPGISINPLVANAKEELKSLYSESKSLPNGGKMVFTLHPAACFFHANGTDEKGNVMPYRDKLYAFYDLLASLSIPVVVHIGVDEFLCDSQQRNFVEHGGDIEKLGYLIDTGAIVILSHSGTIPSNQRSLKNHPDHFQTIKEILKTHPNVYADVSRAFSSSFNYMLTILELFENEEYRRKLIHGSDFPTALGDLKPNLETLKNEDQDNPFVQKAKTVYSAMAHDKNLGKLTFLDSYARIAEIAMQSLGVDENEIQTYFTNGARLLGYHA